MTNQEHHLTDDLSVFLLGVTDKITAVCTSMFPQDNSISIMAYTPTRTEMVQLNMARDVARELLTKLTEALAESDRWEAEYNPHDGGYFTNKMQRVKARTAWERHPARTNMTIERY